MSEVDWDDMQVPQNLPLYLGETREGLPALGCDWCFRPIVVLSRGGGDLAMLSGDVVARIQDHANAHHNG